MADDPALAMSETVRPPLENGELVFDAPWQGRVFAMAVSLAEAGVFEWPAMQAKLIEHVGAWDAENPIDARYDYFEHFSNALNAVLSDAGVVDQATLSSVTDALAQRPHGHDHSHPHSHSHPHPEEH